MVYMWCVCVSVFFGHLLALRVLLSFLVHQGTINIDQHAPVPRGAEVFVSAAFWGGGKGGPPIAQGGVQNGPFPLGGAETRCKLNSRELRAFQVSAIWGLFAEPAGDPGQSLRVLKGGGGQAFRGEPPTPQPDPPPSPTLPRSEAPSPLSPSRRWLWAGHTPVGQGTVIATVF